MTDGRNGNGLARTHHRPAASHLRSRLSIILLPFCHRLPGIGGQANYLRVGPRRCRSNCLVLLQIIIIQSTVASLRLGRVAMTGRVGARDEGAIAFSSTLPAAVAESRLLADWQCCTRRATCVSPSVRDATVCYLLLLLLAMSSSYSLF